MAYIPSQGGSYFVLSWGLFFFGGGGIHFLFFLLSFMLCCQLSRLFDLFLWIQTCHKTTLQKCISSKGDRGKIPVRKKLEKIQDSNGNAPSTGHQFLFFFSLSLSFILHIFISSSSLTHSKYTGHFFFDTQLQRSGREATSHMLMVAHIRSSRWIDLITLAHKTVFSLFRICPSVVLIK